MKKCWENFRNGEIAEVKIASDLRMSRRRRCRCRRRWRRRRCRRCRRLPKNFSKTISTPKLNLCSSIKNRLLGLSWVDGRRIEPNMQKSSNRIVSFAGLAFHSQWTSHLMSDKATFRVGPMNPIAFQPYLIEVTFKVPWNERLKTGRYWVILGIQVSYTARQNRDLSTTPASE